NIPVTGDPVLLFTFIGMKKEEINVAGKKVINVVLKEELTTVDEVVVTGIYSRKKESFTGSSETYTTKELKMVGNKNILESLRTLDPAFNIIENNQYGSDPNRLPDIEIRGKK
ncbi:MAG: SusC/RagA family TonB-linked outer membrane protein, partial [Butyricimonas faecihominis]